MLTPTVTHYAHADHSDDFAVCGAPLDDMHVNLGEPTCPRCAAILAAERALDQAIEDTPLPLDAEEARIELFDYAVALARVRGGR
jgi:hypothetical protein